MMRALAFAMLGLLFATSFASAQTPTSAPNTPTPTANLARYAGQLLDVQHGFAFFTSGDAFRLAPNVRVIDLASGAPREVGATTTRMYARATFDVARGLVTELALSKARVPSGPDFVALSEVKRFAVAVSSPAPNPDLDPNRGVTGTGRRSGPLTGKIVAVRFIVRVPPSTRFSEAVYMSTDTSGWNATAIRLERIDGLHYSVGMPLATGTEFSYRYTRGSWTSVERGRTGLEEPARAFFLGATAAGEPDTRVRDDIVSNWSDENPAGPNVGPNALPTPFNSRPFGFPTVPPTTRPTQQPTSRPPGG